MSESNLPALQAELEAIAAEAARWAEVEASESTALVHVGTADPERMREQMIETRREARRRSKDLEVAAAKVKREIQAEVDRQRAEMEAKMRVAMEMLEPLKQQVKRMEEGIWTVNLYLGTQEEIVTLRTGKPVDIDTPLHFRTSVLAMDEEVAAFPSDAHGVDWQGMDYRDIESFDRWLVEDPEHLRQVLPEERGIVVFTPRRTAKVYDENPLINEAMNEGNFESYWLIRNGENLYRLSTNFKVGGTLMPVTSEFTALFQRTRYNRETHEDETIEVLPGTREWEDAEKAQDGKRRHYMRVALIVQGLIDRTDIFDPIHAGVNVMQQRTYDDGLIVVINDTEKAIASSREPYYKWIERLNGELRPGMRIIGHFGSRDFAGRIHPSRAPQPASDVLHTIEARRTWEGHKGALVIRYERTDKVQRRGAYWWEEPSETPQRRASAVILPRDHFVIPFDLVTIEEMQEYLNARSERHAYADAFPLLQSAIAAKRSEAEAEAPFRDLLTRVLADDNSQDEEEVRPHIDGLVHRYKLGNRWHKPLASMDAEQEAHVLRMIRAEYQRIVRSGADDGRDARAAEVLRKHDPEVMFIGRLSSGRYVAFAPQKRAYGPAVAHQTLWVREHTTGKTARAIATRDWIAPGVRGNKMVTLFETEQWADWDRATMAHQDFTDAQMDEMLNAARNRTVAALSATGDDLLAIDFKRKNRQWITYGTDRTRAHGGYYRRGEGACYGEFTFEATAEGLVRRNENGGGRAFEMSYEGNRGLDRDYKRGHERDVIFPWRSRAQGFGRTNGPLPETVLWEADAAVLAKVTKWAQDEQSKIDEEWDLSVRVRNALYAVNGAQKALAEEEVKAAFLAEYPDEEMWEERRDQQVKNLKPEVDVTHGHHFKRHVREVVEGMAVTHILEREDDAVSLAACLRMLYANGQNWEGLSIEDAYRLLDMPLPDTYTAIGSIRLVDGWDD